MSSASARPPTPAETASISSPDSLRPLEGRYVLHCFFRWRAETWHSLDGAQKAAQREAFFRLVEELRRTPDTQLLLFSVVSPKADWGFMLTMEELHQLDLASKRLARVWGPGVCELVESYFSMTEKSEYTTTEEEFAASLRAEENLDPASPAGQERVAAFRERMAKYEKDRLYPNLADWPVLCFYPMSKRREPGQNWYALPASERRDLMKGHARVGRAYAGRIRQLITGSTGLDRMEWGVTLFAHNLSEIKNIVYEMRFDPVSAHFAEFGDFFIGLQLSPAKLAERLEG